jgi:hypothetical protein
MEAPHVSLPAIGLLLPKEPVRGLTGATAFAVSEHYALTAFHCVGNRKTGVLAARDWEIRFSGGEKSSAVVADRSIPEDVALLRLTSGLPPGRAPLRLAHAGPELTLRRFRAKGFPRERPFPADAETVTGTIADPLGTAFDGIPAIHLYSDQAAAGFPLGGLSGAPVMIEPGLYESHPGSGSDTAVGLIRWNPPNPSTPGTAFGGIVYATPVSVAEQRWPELRSAFVQPPVVVLPYQTAIGNFVRRQLGHDGQPVPFGGRAAQLDELTGWLGDPQGTPFALVTGGAGRGKSALLVRWCTALQQLGSANRARTVFVPVTAGWDLYTETAVLQALVSRLAAVHGEPSALGTVDELREALGRYLTRAPPDDVPLVVVIDGLDEAGWEAGPAFFPSELAAGVRLVVSARLTADRATAEEWQSALGWSARARKLRLDGLSVSGVAEAIRSMGGPLASLAGNAAAVAALHHVSNGGDPLLLSLYLQDLWERPDLEVDEVVPTWRERAPGLDAYMDGWWRDQAKLWGKTLGKQERAIRDVFNVLCCARGPLRRLDLLTPLGGPSPALDTDSLNDALTVLRRFVVSDSEHREYWVSHPLLADHRRRRLGEDGALAGYEERFLAWGRAVVDGLADGSLKSADAPPYVVRHYGDHLEDTAAGLQDFLRLASPYWKDAWDAVTGEYEGHLPDVVRAQRMAATANAEAIERGSHPVHLREQLACALWRSQSVASARLVSPALAAQFVRFGLWPPQRAVALVRQASTASDRMDGLAAVAPVLPVSEARAAEDLLAERQQVDPLASGPALAAVAQRLCDVNLTSRAYRLAQEQQAGYARGRTWIPLVERAAAAERPGLLSSILADLAAASPSVERWDLLTVLTTVVPWETAVEVFGAGPDGAARAVLPCLQDPDGDAPEMSRPDAWEELASGWLPALLPWLSEGTRERVLRDVLRHEETGISEGGRWAQHEATFTLIELAPHYTGKLADLVADFSLRTLSGNGRVELLARVLPRVSPGMREQIEPEVTAGLVEVIASGTVQDHGKTLALLACEGFTNLALDAIAGLAQDSWEPGGYLEAVAPHLNLDATKAALGIALRTRQEIRDDGVAPLLARLASFSAATAQDAMTRARELATDQDELQAARASLPAHDVDHWLDTALGIEDDPLRYAAITAAAAARGAIKAADLARAVNAFDSDGYESSKAYKSNRLGTALFGALLPHLPGSELRERGYETGAIVIATGVHERKGTIAIAYFHRLASAGATDLALNQASFLAFRGFEWSLIWAVAGVGLASPAGTSPSSEIRRMIQRIAPGMHRAIAEAAWLRHLPEPKRQQRWEKITQEISLQEAWRLGGSSRTLIELLPAELRRPTIDRLFPPAYFSEIAEGRARGLDTPEARSAPQLVPVLDYDHILHLWVTARLNSDTLQAELRAAIVARLAALGCVDEAFDKLHNVGRSEQAVQALADMLESLPDDHLGRWLSTAHEVAKMPWIRSGRAELWAGASSRLRDLSPARAWPLFKQWLDRPLGRSEFFVDLIAYAAAIRALGETGGYGAFAGLLTCAEH